MVLLKVYLFLFGIPKIIMGPALTFVGVSISKDYKTKKGSILLPSNYILEFFVLGVNLALELFI